ncbi:sulfite oxidase heme-binding subunit YedZ [Aestuariibius insulae]|uniref:sulfite oxidase heme-binding subunit YedZ n=1 Tax=Aestuariibius insulae TaxID=2058287 RepID=UPI00345ECDAB
MAVADRINQGARKMPIWPLYLLALAYAGYQFWLGLSGVWVEPINTLERQYGEAALTMLIVSLTITPIREYLRINLIKFRRALGLIAFFFVVAHFLVWALLDVQSASRVWADIVKRPYVTVGMVGFVLLIPLAATSANRIIRKIGPILWRRIHSLVYPAVLLACLHYLWLARGFQIEPIAYLVITIGLLVLRLKPVKRRVAA